MRLKYHSIIFLVFLSFFIPNLPEIAYARGVKKGGADRRLMQGCWKQQDGGVTICLGDDGRLRTTVFLKKEAEAFSEIGMYMVRGGGLDFLGWPGEAWPFNTHHVSCVYDISDPLKLQLSDCELSGDWKKVCTKLDKNLECKK